jgi:hypothetical protein
MPRPPVPGKGKGARKEGVKALTERDASARDASSTIYLLRGRGAMKKRSYQRTLILAVLLLLGSALVPCVASGQENSILAKTNPDILYINEAGSEGDGFGYGVAVDGNKLAIGAPYDDDKGDNSGCVYLYNYTNYTESINDEQAKLAEMNDPQSNNSFGNSLDISGDTLVIGIYYRNVNNQSHAGAAYVVQYPYDESQDTWDTEGVEGVVEGVVELTGDQAKDAEFGYAVAISGDVVVVGAPYDSEKALYSGSIYVFRKSGSTWIRETKLFDPDPQQQEYFGSSVAIDGDTIAVGAIGRSDERNLNTGSVFVFTYKGPQSQPENPLFGNDLGDGDKFGSSVALEGDTLIVGAPYHDDLESNKSNSGAAYVFRRNAETGTWSQEKDPFPLPDLSATDRFGNSVALSGNTAVVGASRYDLEVYDTQAGENTLLKDAGSAYLFRFDGAQWQLKDRLTAPDAAKGDEFGFAVAISGNIVLVGAYRGDYPEMDSGCAYVYTLVPENHPPVADAGVDLEVEEGSEVILDGSNSYDPDYDDLELEYLWSQTGGLDVKLDIINEKTLTFTAPAWSAENEKLTFRLEVKDDSGATSFDDVEVTVLPSPKSVTEINSVLGSNHRPWGIDKDIYTFQGTEGRQVTVTLKAKTGGKNNHGDRATLQLKDNIRGISFSRVDSGRLPNQIFETLPATGEYQVIVAGEPRFFRGKRFLGEYTLTVEGASGSLEKGAGSPVVHKNSGCSAKAHKEHPIWSWIMSRFRH